MVNLLWPLSTQALIKKDGQEWIETHMILNRCKTVIKMAPKRDVE